MQNLEISEKDVRVATIKLLQQAIINIIEMRRKIKLSTKEKE